MSGASFKNGSPDSVERRVGLEILSKQLAGDADIAAPRTSIGAAGVASCRSILAATLVG